MKVEHILSLEVRLKYVRDDIIYQLSGCNANRLEIYNIIGVLGTPVQKNLYTPMFIAAQFTIAKCWKQPKCPSVNEWIKNCCTFT